MKLTNHPSLILHKKQIAVIFFIYASFALIFGIAYRYALNPDGLSLLRLAGYIAEGNFIQSIASGWSPLITWLISPLIFLGFDGLTAARIAIALCGSGLLISSWLLASRFNISENNRFIALLITALLISFWTIQFIAADVLIAAITLLYIYLVTDPEILNNRRAPFVCGIVAGLSYLAHHYALPFFLAHFPSILLMKGYMEREKEGLPIKKILISWGLGIAGFAIIASIWIGTVSVKYGKITISSKGPIAHALMGPKDVDRRPPHFYGGLNKPKNEYSMHVFEDPSGLKFQTWSPFESKEYFVHQLILIKNNAIDILNHFVKQSPFFTYAFVVGILIIIPLAFLMNILDEKKKYLYAWVIITFSIYCSGFLLLIARSPRRFYPLMIIFVLLTFHFLDEMKNALRDVMPDRRRQLVTFYLLIIIVSAFAMKPGVQLLKSLNNIMSAEQVNPYSEMAEDINAIQFTAPYAIIRSSQKPHTDLYIAYFVEKQFLGRPLSEDAEGIAKELKEVGAKSLLVFDNPEIVEKLKSDNRFLLMASKKFSNVKRYEQTVNINIRDHEIITGWDEEVNVFILQ